MNSYAKSLALEDIKQGLKRLNLAAFLAWDDIRQRYVRTFLGPFWIVLSTGIWFSVMGLVMANLFHQELHSYMPFLVSGLLAWILISSCIGESSTILTAASGLITSFPIPIFIHYIRFILRNYIIFLHNVVILLAVLVIFPPPVTYATLLVIPGMIVNLCILLGLAMFLSLVNLRYRDTHLAVGSAMQVLPFVTPIFWTKEMLQRHQWIADVNPFYHMVEIMRAPMLGQAPAIYSWIFTGCLAIILPLMAVLLYRNYRHRIIFWL